LTRYGPLSLPFGKPAAPISACPVIEPDPVTNKISIITPNRVQQSIGTLLVGLSIVVAACSGTPHVTTTQKLSQAADAPYDNLLVVSLFESFDMRGYLEKEIVKSLSGRGVNAVRSTSLMDSRTPATRETFLAMVEELDSDAVLSRDGLIR